MHTCHYRNELVGAVHGCTKCRLKSNHEIAGVSPYHSSSSLPPTHPLSSASWRSPPPSPLFSYSATPLRFFPLSRARFSSFSKIARSLACLLPGEFKYPCLTELRVCDTRRPCSDIGWREDTCVRIFCGYLWMDGPLHWRIEGLARVWILCLGWGRGLFGGESHPRVELGYSRSRSIGIGNGMVLDGVNGDIGLFRPIYCFNPGWLVFWPAEAC